MRNDINNKPHEVLWLGLAVILGFAYIFPCEAIDIQFFNTYLVIPPLQLASFFIFPLIILGGIYALTIRAGKKLIKWMTMFHIAFSLFFTITLIYAACEMEVLSFFKDMKFQLAILLFVLAQLTFILNIAYAFLKKNK